MTTFQSTQGASPGAGGGGGGGTDEAQQQRRQPRLQSAAARGLQTSSRPDHNQDLSTNAMAADFISSSAATPLSAGVSSGPTGGSRLRMADVARGDSIPGARVVGDHVPNSKRNLARLLRTVFLAIVIQ